MTLVLIVIVNVSFLLSGTCEFSVNRFVDFLFLEDKDITPQDLIQNLYIPSYNLHKMTKEDFYKRIKQIKEESSFTRIPEITLQDNIDVTLLGEGSEGVVFLLSKKNNLTDNLILKVFRDARLLKGFLTELDNLRTLIQLSETQKIQVVKYETPEAQSNYKSFFTLSSNVANNILVSRDFINKQNVRNLLLSATLKEQYYIVSYIEQVLFDLVVRSEISVEVNEAGFSNIKLVTNTEVSVGSSLVYEKNGQLYDFTPRTPNIILTNDGVLHIIDPR